jgi:hypothetical protein
MLAFQFDGGSISTIFPLERKIILEKFLMVDSRCAMVMTVLFWNSL